MKQPFLLVALLLFTTLSFATIRTEVVEITEKQEPNGDVIFLAKNTGYCPVTLVLDFKELKNFKPDLQLPAEITLQPSKEMEPVLHLQRVNKGQGANYNYMYYSFMGTSNTKPDDYTYTLPYENGTKQLIGQGYNGRFSHKGLYAVDFNLKQGTKICAARPGVVVELKEDSGYGCKQPSCQSHANYILIYHADGTFSYYAHLQKNGVLVDLGDKVEAGQVIGKSGNTGWSSGPHLHFEVYQPINQGKQTIPVTFRHEEGIVKNPKPGKSYTASHQ